MFGNNSQGGCIRLGRPEADPEEGLMYIWVYQEEPPEGKGGRQGGKLCTGAAAEHAPWGVTSTLATGSREHEVYFGFSPIH